MEMIWLGFLFLSGWDISTCRVRHYHYVADRKTWLGAQTYCRETFMDLATISNTSEMNRLIDTVPPTEYNSEVWIGLYSRIDWKWSDGYNGSGADYRNWETQIDNQPDFYSHDQLCVSSGDTGGWWDDHCGSYHYFICYKGTQLEPEFVVVRGIKNWPGAQRSCRQKFIDLATVRDDTENQEIRSMVPRGGRAWIGLFRDPNMYWSDGSGFEFSYWATSPNVIDSNVVCGVASLQTSGMWMIRSCETRLPFVCYSVPPSVMRQVVKLRMKTEDASVDLNDDAVKADILEKLQGRLKEKEVSRVTLMWREQPDGKVFHMEG